MLRRQVALAALVVGGLIPLGHMDTNFSVNLLVTTGVRGRYCSKACLWDWDLKDTTKSRGTNA